MLRRADKKEAAEALIRLDRSRDGLVSLDEYLSNTFGYSRKEIDAMETDDSIDAKNFLDVRELQ